MVTVREPILHPVPIASLRPTQITVGMREVHEKRKGWRAHKGKKRGEFLGKHMIPVILGTAVTASLCTVMVVGFVGAYAGAAARRIITSMAR